MASDLLRFRVLPRTLSLGAMPRSVVALLLAVCVVAVGARSAVGQVGSADIVVNDAADSGVTGCEAGDPVDATTVQGGIVAAAASQTVFVCPGTYTENIAVNKSITLQGANVGTAGNGTRATESLIKAASAAPVVTVQSDGVTLDGFRIDAATGGGAQSNVGVLIGDGSEGQNNVTVQNTIVENIPTATIVSGTLAGGILGVAETTPVSGNTIARNLLQNFDPYSRSGGLQSANAGIGLGGLFQSSVTDNVTDNVAFGIWLIAQATGSQTISGGSHTGNHRGIVVYPPAVNMTYTFENMSFDGNAEYGITIFRSSAAAGATGGDVNATVTAALNNLTIQNTGNFDPDASGLNVSGDATGGQYDVTVNTSTISDNANRGLSARATDDQSVSVTVNNSTLEGNGHTPNGSGNANGLIAQRGAVLTINNSFISNRSATNSASGADAVAAKSESGSGDRDVGRVTVSESEILAPVGEAAVLAAPGGSGNPGFLNASGIWWGSTDPSAFAITDASNALDYTPWLNGNDSNTSTPGFQGDFSTLFIDAGSPQTGATTRYQEALDLGATTITPYGDGTKNEAFAELTINASDDLTNLIGPIEVTDLTYDGQPADPLPALEVETITINNGTFPTGSSTITVINGEIVTNVSSISNSPTFDVQRQFTGTDGADNDAGWRILTSPRAATAGDNLSDNLNFSTTSGSILHRWNGTTQEFEALDGTSSSSLPSGEGFFLYLFDINGRDQIDADPSCASGSACINVTGPLGVSSSFPTSETFGTGDVNVSVPASDNAAATEAGYVLGNPFAQSFDLSNLIVDDGTSTAPIGQNGLFSATVQAWNPLTEQFVAITEGDPTGDRVAPWQGFWILRQSGAPIEAATLTFESAGRTNSAPFIPAATSPVGRFYVDLSVENGGETIAESRASVYARDIATTGEDAYDAPRITPPLSTYAQVSLVRDDGTRKIQESLPYGLAEAVTVPLHTEAIGMSGTATLTTSEWTNLPPDWSVTLEDTETGAQVPLAEGQTYTFDLEQTTSAGSSLGGGVQGDAVTPRFRLRVGPNAPLPVEMTAFDGSADGTTAILSWTTASETNNAGFNVQRKTDAGRFETVRFVDGAGTTTESTTYRIRVEDLDYGAHTFRLQQVDLDGSTALSDEVPIDIRLQSAYAISQVAPNPVRGQGRVEVAVRETGPVTLALYDLLGRRITTLHEGPLEGGTTHHFTVDGGRLASGTYFLRMQGRAGTDTQRVTVVR